MKIIIRKKITEFYSIEKVFYSLSSHLRKEIVELPYSSKGLLNRVRNILFLKKLQPESLHISGHDHYLLLYPFRNSILTIHDLEALKRKSGIKKWMFQKLWFDLPIRNASMVTTISEFTKKELLSIKKFDTPIHIIPNPITISLPFNPKTDWSKRLKILHIGTKANKNLIRLAQALNGLSCELMIIGKLKDSQLKALNENDIYFTNKVAISDDELMKEYEACDLLAFVSIYEGFGLPIIEAQAVGRVVLTSNVSSMPEVAGNGAYFVNPYSVDEIKKAILHLSQNREVRMELIEKGKENIVRYHPENIANMYNQLYRNIEQ